jgi:hypothetical protein
MFFGPFSTLRTTYSIIAAYGCVSLIGSRHSGKTTLLRCLSLPAIQARFQEYDFSHHLFVYIDVRNCLRKTCDGFVGFVCEKIIAAAQEHFELSSSKAGEDRFMDILQQVKQQGYHTVMLLDVFDEITRNKAFDPEFFMFLRAQASGGLVSYVTASIRPLDQISHQDIQGSPFFNIFSPSHIKPLTPQEACDLVMFPSQQAGYPFTKEECAWVLNLAGRHPFFIMSACNALFTFRETFSQPTSEQDREALEDEIYNSLSPHFKYLWNDLSNKHQMSIIAKTQQLGADIADEPLSDFIESSLFCRFVCTAHVFIDTIEDELKDVLEHLDSPSFLANSKLRYLKVVALRIEQRGVTSTFEKGLVIRGILTEAFEQLRGEGARKDTVPSWKVYTILFYTYFSNNGTLNQAGIARHLAMSLRQYHREKDEAIKALANRLLEMEVACKQEDDE